MQLNYVVVDDEPIVHTVIRKFAEDLGGLRFVDSAYRASDALALLKNHSIDLLFLDVQMPALTGFELLRNLDRPPYVIIISAHKDYAVESYEYAITDYLLKPFNFSRFSLAVHKVLQDKARIDAIQQSQPSIYSAEPKSIFIKDDKKQHQIALEALLYIKANGNFTSVYHIGGHILSQMKISDFEKLLPKEKFSRVHRSYLVAHHAITVLKASEISLGDTIIPVGRVYKDELAKLRVV